MRAALETRRLISYALKLSESTSKRRFIRSQSTHTASKPAPSPTLPHAARASADPFTLLAPELTYVRDTLASLVGSSHPALTEIASYYLQLPGKQLRPLLVLLFARATNSLGSGFDARRALPQNSTISPLRHALDAALTSSTILNDWNPRTPDDTSSFSTPFTIPPFLHSPPPFPPEPLSSSPPLPLPPTSSILPTQLRLAQITEMIHVASLLHDDVLDRAETRRASASAPFAFGNKLTVLGGDFLLGRASTALSRLGDNEVVELMSTIISNLVEGEVMQMRKTESKTGSHEVWTTYLRKSYLKTASLMAKSTRSSVVLGGADSGSEADELLKDVAYAYGRNIGIAFQVRTFAPLPWKLILIYISVKLVDDALDFSPSSDLGKPGFGADLKLGLATAPTLYAWEEYPEMGELVNRRFKQEGDVDLVRSLPCSPCLSVLWN